MLLFLTSLNQIDKCFHLQHRLFDYLEKKLLRFEKKTARNEEYRYGSNFVPCLYIRLSEDKRNFFLFFFYGKLINPKKGLIHQNSYLGSSLAGIMDNQLCVAGNWYQSQDNRSLGFIFLYFTHTHAQKKKSKEFFFFFFK